MDRIMLNERRGSALVKGNTGRCSFPNMDGSRCLEQTDVLFVGGRPGDGKQRTRRHICRDHAAPLVGLRARRS